MDRSRRLEEDELVLIRPHDDASDDETLWRDFVSSQGFGQLVASGVGRELPVVVPTQYVLHPNVDRTQDQAPHGQVRLHLAKPNPIFACLAENPRCILNVSGDWAYIPGRWKAIGDEDPREGIPTTYYAAVQLICTATIVDQPQGIAEVLGQQLDDVEPGHSYIDPMDHGAHLKAIRGLLLTIDEVRAKFKYGGNVDAEHRRHIADKLELRGGAGDTAARANMYLEPNGN